MEKAKSNASGSRRSLVDFLKAFFSDKMFVIAMIVFAIDRVSKHLAIESCPCVLGPFLNIIVSRNKGVAFGLLKNLADANTIFTISTIVISLVLIYLYMASKEPFIRVGLPLMLGGALGNLFDRLFYDAVIDIVDLHVSIWRFPAFNFADAAITAGAVIIILGLLLTDKQRKNQRKPSSAKRKSSSAKSNIRNKYPKKSQDKQKRPVTRNKKRKTSNR